MILPKVSQNILGHDIAQSIQKYPRPWHYPLLKQHLPDGAGLLGYRWWNQLTKSWAWTRFPAGSQVASKGG
jgi:hypothetical protein